MGEVAKATIQVFTLSRVEADHDRYCESSSFYGDSDDSMSSSSSSSELADDATSSSSPSSSSSLSPHSDSNGSSFDLSSVMADLPIKRGLSKYFQGKSESFRSLSDVRCIEDLAKEENPGRKRMKACGSYELGGAQRPGNSSTRLCSRTISKKASRRSYASSLARRNRCSLSLGSKLPDLPLQKNL